MTSRGTTDRSSRLPRLRVAASAGALVLGLAACGGTNDVTSTTGSGPSDPVDPRAAPTETMPALDGDVVVFAAASLTDSFAQIADGFMAVNPGVTVTLNHGASSSLAQQIVSGSPADVFASASPATLAVVTDAGLSDGEPVVFVRNRLEIAVPAGNPGRVTGLADFADADLTIALCAEEVPCGAAAVEAFAAAGITPAPDTLEQDVRAVLTKVELGEVDAALVYRTDVLVAGGTVEGIAFPESEEAVNDYPIVLLAEAPNPDVAQAFMAYVLSDAGIQVLADAGFDVE